jgi:hypothetical protein
MTTHNLDTIRCQHCQAIIALLPVRCLKGRVVIACPHCTTPRVIRPPEKRIDIVAGQTYTLAEV